MEYYLALKTKQNKTHAKKRNNKISHQDTLLYATTWMKLEDTTVGKIRVTEG